ncbi:MAG: glycosyltransferase [Anaerolineae bacterium]
MDAVSLIVTVKNEAGSLPRLLDSVLAQTRRPDEVIIADGGSTDGTRAVLAAYAARLPLIVLDCPGANISQGRNAAIARARGPIIASTDAGVRLDPRWLAQILAPFDPRPPDAGVRLDQRRLAEVLAPFLSVKPPDVVAGFFLPDPHGAFETALAATTLPALRDIRGDRFLPSSRSIAFTKAAWEKVRGYPEWLDYCEDLIFDLDLRAAGLRFKFAPEARVYFRPRASLRQFIRQYYLYARGDGKANLWLKRHLARYFTYLVALPLLALLFFNIPWLALLIGLTGCFIMFYTPYRRLLMLWGALGMGARLAALCWTPVIRLAGDIAKMVGYPVGVKWRMERVARNRQNAIR